MMNCCLRWPICRSSLVMPVIVLLGMLLKSSYLFPRHGQSAKRLLRMCAYSGLCPVQSLISTDLLRPAKTLIRLFLSAWPHQRFNNGGLSWWLTLEKKLYIYLPTCSSSGIPQWRCSTEGHSASVAEKLQSFC